MAETYIEHWRTRIRTGQLPRDFLGGLLYCLKGYIMFLAVIIPCQRLFMYVPATEWIVAPQSVGADIVSYGTADGVLLTSWFHSGDVRRPVIIMFHGNAGNISHRYEKYEYFAQRGYGFLLAEYRGYSGNAGSPSENGLYADGRAALAWLKDIQHVAENDIIIYGESIGTGVAVQMALEHPAIKALVLEAPPTGVAEVAAEKMPWLAPVKFLMLDRYESVLKVPNLAMPFLVVHGDEDEVVPFAQGMQVFNAGRMENKQMVVLKGGRHNDLFQHGLAPAIEEFIHKL